MKTITTRLSGVFVLFLLPTLAGCSRGESSLDRDIVLHSDIIHTIVGHAVEPSDLPGKYIFDSIVLTDSPAHPLGVWFAQRMTGVSDEFASDFLESFRSPSSSKFSDKTVKFFENSLTEEFGVKSEIVDLTIGVSEVVYDSNETSALFCIVVQYVMRDGSWGGLKQEIVLISKGENGWEYKGGVVTYMS